MIKMKTNRNSKRIFAALLAAVLIVRFGCLFVYAEEIKGKSETVTATLKSNGEPESVHVINLIHSVNGIVEDYGKYDSVKNISSSDKIEYSNGKISCSSKQEKLYYLGELSNPQLPWNISIAGVLDGKPARLDDITGKNGELEITVKAEKNNKCEGEFFENYMLSFSVSLDKDVFSNVRSEDTLIKNAANSYDINTISAPGSGMNIVFSADVRNFEMPEMVFDGSFLDYDISGSMDDSRFREKLDGLSDISNDVDNMYDDNSELKKLGEISEINDLKNSSNELYDSARAFDDGTAELIGGTDQVYNGTDELEDGVFAFYNGTVRLKDGVQELLDVLNEYKDIPPFSMMVSEMKGKVEDILSGTESLRKGALSILDGIVDVNDAVADMKEGISNASENSGKMVESAEKIRTAGGDIDSRVKELDQDVKKNYDEKVSELKKQAEDIGKEIDEVYQDIESEFDKLKDENGKERKVVSFVSEKNTEVDSVVFSIKTAPIVIGKTDFQKEEKKNFWQRLWSGH